MYMLGVKFLLRCGCCTNAHNITPRNIFECSILHPRIPNFKIFRNVWCSVLQSLIKGSCKIKRAKKSCTTNLQQAIQSKSLTYTYHYLTLILIIDYLPRAFSTKISLLKRVFLEKHPPNSYFEQNFSIAEFCDLHFNVREICISCEFRP